MRLLGCFFLLLGGLFAGEAPVRGVFNSVTGLHRYDGCLMNPRDWSDGDSFSLRFPDDKDYTIRLYGVDCLETSGENTTDARRLRAQRRYFGVSMVGGSAQASNDLAKEWGRKAKARVAELLAKKCTVYTAWSDGRGSARFKRYYGFVTLGDGRDLASVLVEEGLARAFGVYRRGPTGESADDYREVMRDLELGAAVGKRGIWKQTDWKRLPVERQAERDEAAELEAARDRPQGNIDPNSASRDELMTLPGIGEKTALAIIEARESGPYRKAEDLSRVRGIGKVTVEKLRSCLHFPGEKSGTP